MHSPVSSRAAYVRAGGLILALASTVFVCAAVQAQRPGASARASADAAASTDACSVPAYILPPAEPLVRAAPSRSGAVVGRLNTAQYDADDIEGANVTIVEIKDDWARIAAASASNDVTHDIPAGWIETRHLAFVLQTDLGFVAPDPDSAIAYSAEDWIPSDRVRRFLGCRGEWLHLTVRDDRGKRRTGWFRGACSNQRTTCDGTYGDHRTLVEPAN
ncbi:MAG: hypothetical protein KA144_03630 [Xanthomonadaceae bacterium]|nr:hypothetical protein [Xanthomonadaceae bacterium]